MVHPPIGVATLLPMAYGLLETVEHDDSVWTLTSGTVYPAAPPGTLRSQVSSYGVLTVAWTLGKSKSGFLMTKCKPTLPGLFSHVFISSWLHCVPSLCDFKVQKLPLGVCRGGVGGAG